MLHGTDQHWSRWQRFSRLGDESGALNSRCPGRAGWSTWPRRRQCRECQRQIRMISVLENFKYPNQNACVIRSIFLYICLVGIFCI